jgi:calcineurin-like phosphoesterase family protein
MNKWFISDTHFSHANIIRYTGRPFQSVNEMDERLIENWNALIAPEDIVFFLGDFGLGTTDFLTDLCMRLHDWIFTCSRVGFHQDRSTPS